MTSEQRLAHSKRRLEKQLRQQGATNHQAEVAVAALSPAQIHKLTHRPLWRRLLEALRDD
ncbi:MAG: hypothetical protein JJU22_03965 [Gammaproteobacteria bacterium]|nr:hypothetical protein [Gammaproteobacteria bacterium]